MVRFVATADWQLGMTRHFLSAEAQARFTAARIDAVSSIAELASSERASFVVVAGDVFESNQVPRQIVTRALTAMGDHPGLTFYLLPGNHDPLDASSLYRSPTFLERCPANVVVLDDTAPRIVAPGVELIGAPWRNKRPLVDLVGEVVSGLRPDGTLRVVVGHGAIDVFNPERSDPAMVVLADLDQAISRGSVHAVILGDRHSTTSVGSTGRVLYPGAPEPTDFVEVDAGNVVVCELGSNEFATTTHSVATWTFRREVIDLAGPEDVATLAGALDEIPRADRTILRLGLTGALSLAAHAELSEVLELHGERLGALERWDAAWNLVVLADDLDLDVLALSGFANEALAELRGEATRHGTDGDRAANDALALLYRLGTAS